MGITYEFSYWPSGENKVTVEDLTQAGAIEKARVHKPYRRQIWKIDGHVRRKFADLGPGEDMRD